MRFFVIGISSYADNPSNASQSLLPLLRFASHHIPHKKHHETPLYILATAGMRLLTKNKRNAILDNLKTEVPKMSEFFFTESQVDVISGKQEGMYVCMYSKILKKARHIFMFSNGLINLEVDVHSEHYNCHCPHVLKRLFFDIL